MKKDISPIHVINNILITNARIEVSNTIRILTILKVGNPPKNNKPVNIPKNVKIIPFTKMSPKCVDKQ